MSDKREEPVAMTVIARSDDLRIINRHRVMSAVRRSGKLSRIDIARNTGLSAATVTAIASELVERNLLMGVEATDRKRAGRGRPKAELSINPAVANVVTMVFKRNTVSGCLYDFSGQAICERETTSDTSTMNIDQFRKLLIGGVRDLVKTADNEAPLMRIVVGVQGTTDINGEIMLWSPITNHRNLPIAEWLSQAFQVPTRIWNDCDMIAQSLHWNQPDEFGADFAAILLSYGVGMALFQAGGQLNGCRSSGMEFGHMTYVPSGDPCRCGNRGCIEAYAGDYAIAKRAGISPPDIDSVVEAARNGNARAIDALAVAGAALGTGLANLFALTDPIPVALVGSGAKAFVFLEAPMRQALRESIGGEASASIAIGCLPDEKPIIHQGCAISALTVLDRDYVEFE